MTTLLALVTVALFATSVSSKAAPEKALAKHLLNTYEELGIAGRPVEDVKDTVKVTIGLDLIKILKVDKKHDTIKVSALLELRWTDPFLEWEPKEHDGVESIALSAEDIWTPDISVWNDIHQSASEQDESMEDADVLIDHDGKVIWVPKLMYKVSCDEDEKVDGQLSCSFVLGSWVHDATKIDIDFDDDKADIELDMFDPTPGIEIVENSATKELKEFECCPDLKYAIVTYNLVIKHTTAEEGHCDSKDGACSSDKAEENDS